MDQEGLRGGRTWRWGRWIAPRLGPFAGQVGSVAPQGFAAYARVLHPVPDGSDPEGPQTRWAEVCEFTGRPRTR